MLPSVVIQQVQDSLLDYLTTTLRLRDAELEAALRRFLLDPEDGIFRGPYLDVRLPFRKVDEGAERPLDLAPRLWPYAHQLRAFERLTSRDGRTPRSTLVTTGTGSGKTECFLWRARRWLGRTLRPRRRLARTSPPLGQEVDGGGRAERGYGSGIAGGER
ncbi:MAG TPA: hypothetical protein PLU22_14380 [Polyangiaceae bacterium]|nr:hypothetical protein [Polyangiaceae bacterium]